MIRNKFKYNREYLKNKTISFFRKPLPIWSFLAFLIILFVINLLKSNISQTLYDGLTYTLSTIFGGFITYFAQFHKEQRKNLSNQLNIAQATIRYLSLQYLQLINLQKDLENRQGLLKEVKREIENQEESLRKKIITITQDFCEDIYRINLSKLYNITTQNCNRTQFEEALLSVFLLDRNYLSTINSILDINKAKRDYLKDTLDVTEFISKLYNNLIEDRLEIVKNSVQKNLNALDELQNIFEKIFGKKFKKIKYGEISLRK